MSDAHDPGEARQLLLLKLAGRGISVDPSAVPRLDEILDKGRENIYSGEYSGVVHVSKADVFASNLDELADRISVSAAALNEGTLAEGSISEIMSGLCPGFYPWC